MTHAENEIVEGSPMVHLFIPVAQCWKFEFQVSKQRSGPKKGSVVTPGEVPPFMGSQAWQEMTGKGPGLCSQTLCAICGQVFWECQLSCLTNILDSFVSPKHWHVGNNPTPATEGQFKLKGP